MVDMIRNFGKQRFCLEILLFLLLVFTFLIWLNQRSMVVLFSSDEESGRAPQDELINEFLASNPPRDAGIISYLHEFHLEPPSAKPYKFTPIKDEHPSEFLYILRQLFGQQTNGFFVEAGANDGQLLSNTLWLEMEQNWTGLLVEPNSFMLPTLRLVNRKAWIADVCLSTVPYPVKVRFTHNIQPHPWNSGQGYIEKSAFRDLDNYVFAGAVDCFPLATLLTALNQTVVDYFSLDIEGVELKVLKTIPFDKITIKVISIEHNLIPEGFEALKDLLDTNGFEIVFKSDGDLFAVHKDYTKTYKLSN